MDEDKKPVDPKIPTRQIAIPIDVNSYYINGASVGLTPTEIQLNTAVNGRPTSKVLIPFPVAKSIALGILEAIKDYENKTSVKVLEVNEIGTSLQK